MKEDQWAEARKVEKRLNAQVEVASLVIQTVADETYDAGHDARPRVHWH